MVELRTLVKNMSLSKGPASNAKKDRTDECFWHGCQLGEFKLIMLLYLEPSRDFLAQGGLIRQEQAAVSENQHLSDPAAKLLLI